MHRDACFCFQVYICHKNFTMTVFLIIYTIGLNYPTNPNYPKLWGSLETLHSEVPMADIDMKIKTCYSIHPVIS